MWRKPLVVILLMIPVISSCQGADTDDLRDEIQHLRTVNEH
jgi:hypothetical protein